MQGELGRGGMGVVYEGWDLKIERPVALKRIQDSLRPLPEERERMVGEARLVGALKHPSIVTIYASVEEEGELWHVFELVRGRTLRQLLDDRGRLPLGDCRRYMEQCCEALDYAHARGIIHRDVKPSNLMVEAGRVKVMDFGVARRTLSATGTVTSVVIGTPGYMPPEQAFGEVSRESDFYALAGTLYELLSGSRPFSGPDQGERQIGGRFEAISRAAPEAAGLDPFFARALSPDRKARFGGGSAFLAGLRIASVSGTGASQL